MVAKRYKLLPLKTIVFVGWNKSECFLQKYNDFSLTFSVYRCYSNAIITP